MIPAMLDCVSWPEMPRLVIFILAFTILYLYWNYLCLDLSFLLNFKVFERRVVYFHFCNEYAMHMQLNEHLN
jgi:hypothetical protein